MRLISTVLLMLALASPAVAARPLHLEADASRQEVLRGDIVTIDAYLFNDGTTPVQGVLGIRGPAGFELVQATPASIVTIAPGRAIHAKFGYRVLASAPHGLATFVVVAFEWRCRAAARAGSGGRPHRAGRMATTAAVGVSADSKAVENQTRPWITFDPGALWRWAYSAAALSARLARSIARRIVSALVPSSAAICACEYCGSSAARAAM
jgi:hypothetical protein